MTHTHECNRYLPVLSAYLDGEMSAELCEELERHMAECERCRIVVNTTRRTIDLYQMENEGAKAPDGVKERLFKRLNLEDYLVGNGNEQDQ